MNAKKEYQPAEIKIVVLGWDFLITSGGALAEDDWDSFDFSKLK